MVDGALHGGAAPVGINARSCKEFVQRDIIPCPNDLVQLALQLAGLLHPQAHGQRSAAANGLGQRGQKLAPVEPVAPHVNDIGKACKAHHQKDAAEHRAEAGQGLVPLFGVLLLGSGHIVAVDRLSVPGRLTGTGVLGAEIAGIFCVLLLFFFGIPVNGTQDEKQNAQPGRHGEYYRQGNGGNVGKKMFAVSGLHGAESS